MNGKRWRWRRVGWSLERILGVIIGLTLGLSLGLTLLLTWLVLGGGTP